MNYISKYNVVIILILLGGWSSIASQNLITWDKAGNGFWHNKDNWDLGRVPNAMDTVIIAHDSVIVATGEHAMAYKLVLGETFTSGVGLAIFNNASLTILQDVMDEDFGIIIHDASFFNAGLVTVVADVGIDIRLGSYLTNQDSISVTAGSSGITNFGDIINESDGSILTTGSSTGISNNGPLVNDGKIFVDNCSNNGIFVNIQGLENNGLISIANGGLRGIDIYRGQLINLGLINVVGLTEGIRTSGTDTNSGGLLNHDSVSISSCETGLRLVINSTVTNHSKLDIRLCSKGINNDNGSLRNESLGVISIEGIGTISGFGYQSESSGIFGSGGYLENFGQVSLNNLYTGIENCDDCTVVNYQNIDITSFDFGFLSHGIVINSGGDIEFMTGNKGLLVFSEVFRNEQGGTLSIEGCDSESLGVKAYGAFENKMESHVDIKKPYIVPFSIASLGTLDNQGTITVE